MGQETHHSFSDVGHFNLPYFKAKGLHDMIFLRIGLTIPEQRRLAEMVEETRATGAHFMTIEPFTVTDKATHVALRLHGTAATQRIRFIADAATIDHLTHVAVALMVMERCHWAIDRNLVKVGAAQANQLRIRVGDEASLQERHGGEIDARDNVTRMEGHLLGLCEKVIGVTIEGQLANAPDWHQLFRNNFGGVKQIEIKRMLVFFLDKLHA